MGVSGELYVGCVMQVCTWGVLSNVCVCVCVVCRVCARGYIWILLPHCIQWAGAELSAWAGNLRGTHQACEFPFST